MAIDMLTAEALVTSYCGWHISPSQTDTLVLDGPGTNTLLLPTLHVTDVDSVTDDGTVLMVDTDFDWSASGIVERRCGRFSCRLRGLSVTFTHGYDEMPADVQAVMDQILSDGLGPTAVQVGLVRVQTQSGWVSAESILAPYRVPART